MSFRQGAGGLMLADFFEINAVEHEQFGELDSVDHTDAVEFVNARVAQTVFDLGKPWIGDKEFIISFIVGNFSAELLNVPRRNAEPIAYFLQLFSSCQIDLSRGRSSARNFFRTLR